MGDNLNDDIRLVYLKNSASEFPVLLAPRHYMKFKNYDEINFKNI